MVSTAAGFAVGWVLFVLLALLARRLRLLPRDDAVETAIWVYVFTGIAFSTPWTYASISIASEYPPTPVWAFLGGVGMALLMSPIWPAVGLYFLGWYLPNLVWRGELPLEGAVIMVAFMVGFLVVGWLVGSGMAIAIQRWDGRSATGQERLDEG